MFRDARTARNFDRGIAAVVTVPIGILSEIRFTPPLDDEKKNALGSIAMGSVVKVVLQFRTVWWEALDEKLRAAAFFHNFRTEFPTLRTQLPLHVPLLTAWAGGPIAEGPRDSVRTEIVRRALVSLEATFGVPVAEMHLELPSRTIRVPIRLRVCV